MKQENENQQKDLINMLKAYPWSSPLHIMKFTGMMYPTTIVSRVRAKYGDDAIIDRQIPNPSGKGRPVNEYRLSDSFRAMMEVKDIPKKAFPKLDYS